jgi:hypothetical protein
MFTNRNALKTYTSIDDNLSGASFEKRWFESVIMILGRVKAGEFNSVESHKILLKVMEGLQWVQENLNEKLGSQHRTMLKNIYSLGIQIINGAIATGNMQYLEIVISSLKTVLEPYEKK